MTIEPKVPLSSLTTLRAGGDAAFLARIQKVEDVPEALAFARERNIPWCVLGEGSNVLAGEEGYPGLVMRMEIPGVSFEETAEGVQVVAGAGVVWDELVDAAGTRLLWGLENLAGIPGFVGAAPVQNIGAYGAEVKDTFLYADVFDARTGETMRIHKEDAGFGYRDSRFKREGNLIILSVAFTLSSSGTPNLSYGDLAKAKDSGMSLDTPSAISAAVRAIRAKKFPDRSVCGTAGSFFKNPVISEEAYTALAAHYGDIPRFEAPGGVKVPLAFILDKVLNLRGYRMHKAWLYDAQPLVLVLDAGGTAKDVEELATYVENLVREKTNITLEREVRAMNVNNFS